MKILIILACLMIPILYAGAAASQNHKPWVKTVSSKKQGSEVFVFERLIRTPATSYSVAQIVLLKTPFIGAKTIDSVRDFLSKEFALTGLQENKLGLSHRFEGYRSDLRRQVVVYVSWEGSSIKVSSAHYRPMYGRKIALEVELWHRNYHKVDSQTKSYSRIPSVLDLFLSRAHAQSADCSKCSGNPMCLLLCVGASPTTKITTSISPTIGLMGISEITEEISASNKQLLGLNEAAASANNNWTRTNENIEKVNESVHQNVDKIDQRAGEIRDEINNLNTTIEETNQIAERGVVAAEQAMDPKHMSKVAAYTAAGAVMGSTVANLAVAGVKSAIGFLAKWISGDLKRMKQEEIMREFAQAMEFYSKGSDMASKLEAQIDQILASMALYQNFKLDNSDVIENIQRSVVETGFLVKDAYENRCVDDVIKYEKDLLEFQSLSKILSTSANPLTRACADLRDMFTKLAKIEGDLQNARPNLLKAEPTVIAVLARKQNEANKTYAKLQEGKGVEKTAKNKEKQLKKLLKKNEKDTQKLMADVFQDCVDSFDGVNLSQKKTRRYCEDLEASKDGLRLAESFPTLTPSEIKTVNRSFEKKYIALGLQKIKTFEEQREKLAQNFEDESSRHQEETSNLAGRLNFDPEVALNQLSADNKFFEKLMREQAYLFSSGLKEKKLKVEEACSGL